MPLGNLDSSIKINKKDTKNKIFTMLMFGCIGLTTEIIFTALKKIVVDFGNHRTLDLSLSGKTYVWMFFIYGLIPILGDFIYPKVKQWKTIFRLLFYVVLIYLIEFLSGGTLKLILGKCPWEYTTGIHILGIIRLDYFMFWICFIYGVEKIYLYLSQNQVTNTNED